MSRQRLRFLLRERDQRGAADEQVLSVYRDLGVVPKAERDDNFNKTPEDLSHYKLVLRGDLVINKMKAWQGSVAVSPHRGIVSGDYMVCAVMGTVNPKYLHHLLRSGPLMAEYQQRSKGIRPFQWRLYWQDLADIEIVLPNLDQQCIIADFLDREMARIDRVIGAKRGMIEALEERFDSAIYWAVTRGLDASPKLKEVKLGWVRELPTHWGIPTVSANFEVVLGKMLNPEAQSGSDQFPYLRNQDVQWDRIEVTDLPTMHFDLQDRLRCQLLPGDLLVCEGGEVGRAALWKGQLRDCYFQKAVHRVRARRDGNARFLMYCLRAAARQGVFEVGGNVSTIAHLTLEKLKEHRFPWPPPHEQAAIVDRLDRIAVQRQRLTTALDSQIILLQEHRQALITAAVTGEMEIPGAAA